MKIAFYSPHLSLGGTEITLYDFADYNEKLLGNESVIIYNKGNNANHPSVIQKFQTRFSDIFTLNSPEENWTWNSRITVPLLDEVIASQNCDFPSVHERKKPFQCKIFNETFAKLSNANLIAARM